jgi:hypothetical protein
MKSISPKRGAHSPPATVPSALAIVNPSGRKIPPNQSPLLKCSNFKLNMLILKSEFGCFRLGLFLICYNQTTSLYYLEFPARGSLIFLPALDYSRNSSSFYSFPSRCVGSLRDNRASRYILPENSSPSMIRALLNQPSSVNLTSPDKS